MQDISHIGNADHKCKRADDFRAVYGDDVCHQAEYANRRQLHDHHQHPHDDLVHAVHKLCDLLPLFPGGKDACAKQDRDHDHREHIRLHHRRKQIIREYADDDVHDLRSLFRFIGKLGKLRARQRRESALKAGNKDEADGDGNCRCDHIIHKRFDANAAYAPKVLQRDYAIHDRKQNDRDNEELEQIDVDRPDRFQVIGRESGILQKAQADEYAGEHADEDPYGQGKFLCEFHSFTSFIKIDVLPYFSMVYPVLYMPIFVKLT